MDGADDRPSPVIGVAVIKMPFSSIDDMLQGTTDVVSLVNPHGIILSSTAGEWILTTLPGLAHASTPLQAVNPEYFSPPYEPRDTPLAFQPGERFLRWQESLYAVNIVPLALDDPAGAWSVLLLRPCAAWIPVEQALLTGLLLLALCLALASTHHARYRRRLGEIARMQADAEAAQTYRSIFNATTDALFVHQTDNGAVLDANEYARKLYGYADEDLSGLGLDGEFPYPADVARSAFESALKDRAQIITFQARPRNGRAFWAEASFRAYSLNGVIRILAVVHDITEQRNAHAALTASKEVLEKEVRNRTAMLLQSQKMAAIGKFAERVTHDVTNVMTRIIGYIEIIRHAQSEGNPIDRPLREINDAARDMCDFTSDLLAFAHPAPLKLGPMNLARVVGSFQSMISAMAPAGIRVEFRLPEERLVANLSPNHIEQVLTHLALNSFEAMSPPGTLTVIVRRGTPDDAPDLSLMSPSDRPHPRHLAVLEVLDTGPGIPPDILPHIFDPFYTTKTNTRRRGLGLTTVYMIASSHRGWIQADAADGGGTAIRFWLPLTDDERGP